MFFRAVLPLLSDTNTGSRSSLKLKRPPTVKKYRQLLDQLYEQALEEQSAPKAKL